MVRKLCWQFIEYYCQQDAAKVQCAERGQRVKSRTSAPKQIVECAKLRTYKFRLSWHIRGKSNMPKMFKDEVCRYRTGSVPNQSACFGVFTSKRRVFMTDPCVFYLKPPVSVVRRKLISFSLNL